MRGKFIFIDNEKFLIRGVTYGPFRPNEVGCEYSTPDVVAKDFALMAEHGINTVRLYTVPPRWLLDLAFEYGLMLMVGLPWEQHITFLDDRKRMRDIERRVREGAAACAKHPALLALAIGNEIPAATARWYGARRIERFIHRLYLAAKREAPDALVTYVNYPSTEFLDCSRFDFVCFNVFLESESAIDAYVARLHNLADDRPLVVSEIGLDCLRHSEEAQAQTLESQIRTIFAGGAAGVFVFSWTDQWHRGGADIEDWQFGVTTRQREPKPALEKLACAFAQVPLPSSTDWPRISVIVCTYNGGKTIGDCLDGLARVDYSNFEVIVVDDGSTDGVPDIVRRYDVRLIRTPNSGLSNARNTAMLAGTGEIIAYIDDDARPDEHWLMYLASAFRSSAHIGVGGPNVAPRGQRAVAECIDRAPGGPIHVLLDDRLAEHVPGCNMAFRRDALMAIGGFDPQFRIAGDDVDICWRLQQRGWTIGFHPAALVWHRRRQSVGGFWKQQFNYGRAEGMLERKWPSKYNALGHPSWAGRVYSGERVHLFRWRQRIYHGTWGSAAFQSIYQRGPGTLRTIPTTPEWYLIVLVLCALSLASFAWPGLWIAVPLLVAAAAIPIAESIVCGIAAWPADATLSAFQLWTRRALTGWLYMVQPAARLLGRIRSGLTPWRNRAPAGLAIPWPRSFAIWSQRWQSSIARLAIIEKLLQAQNVTVVRGGDFDPWDLEIYGGLAGKARLQLMIEEHGSGKQMIRVRVWPAWIAPKWLTILVLLGLGALAMLGGKWSGFFVFAVAGILLLLMILQEVSIAFGAAVRVLKQLETVEKR